MKLDEQCYNALLKPTSKYKLTKQKIAAFFEMQIKKWT